VSSVRVQGADGVDALRIDFSGSGPSGGEFTVAVANNTLQAIVDGNVIATHSLDGIHALYLTGVAGQNDVVTLDFGSNPDLLTLSTIHVDLEGDASDDLIVISNGQSIDVDYTDVSSGKITIGATSVVFTGLGENTLTVGGTNNLTLTFPDTAENIIFTNHDDAGDSQVSYEVEGDLFTTKFTNPATSLTVNLGNNGPTATFTSLDAAFNPSAGVTIIGGAGDDTITVTSLGTGFTGALAVDGGDGNDSVTFNAVLALASLNVTAETIPVSGASVSTSGGNIDLNGNLTLLGANVLLSTGTGGGNIQIASITGGGNDLQLISGSGTTTVTGAATGLGTVTIQGDLSPSLSDTGTFDVDGSVTFDSTSRFLVNLNGTGNFDQLIVNGDNRTVALGGARLVLVLDSVPEAGSQQSFKIVDTKGTLPMLEGKFKNADGSADLNHGGKFTVGDTVFRIDYIDWRRHPDRSQHPADVDRIRGAGRHDAGRHPGRDHLRRSGGAGRRSGCGRHGHCVRRPIGDQRHAEDRLGRRHGHRFRGRRQRHDRRDEQRVLDTGPGRQRHFGRLCRRRSRQQRIRLGIAGHRSSDRDGGERRAGGAGRCDAGSGGRRHGRSAGRDGGGPVRGQLLGHGGRQRSGRPVRRGDHGQRGHGRPRDMGVPQRHELDGGGRSFLVVGAGRQSGRQLAIRAGGGLLRHAGRTDRDADRDGRSGAGHGGRGGSERPGRHGRDDDLQCGPGGTEHQHHGGERRADVDGHGREPDVHRRRSGGDVVRRCVDRSGGSGGSCEDDRPDRGWVAERCRRDLGGGRHRGVVDGRCRRDDGRQWHRLPRGRVRRNGDGDARQGRRSDRFRGPGTDRRPEVSQRERRPAGSGSNRDADVDPGRWRDGRWRAGHDGAERGVDGHVDGGERSAHVDGHGRETRHSPKTVRR
jgi:hypothetical protein